MNKIFNKKSKGFTPIELLFVFLVMGILILISVLFLNSSRLKAKDSKRLVDIRRIQTAMEFYKLTYDEYPVTVNAINLGVEPNEKLCDKDTGAIVSLQAVCTKEFMQIIPNDPAPNQSYVYMGAKDGYTILFTTQGDTILGPKGVYYAHSNAINNDPKVQ